MIKMLCAGGVENATCWKAEPVAIWKARKYIEEHSGEELSLTKAAKVVNMNANYLSENFKRVTGINFVEYVARARFANACDLLFKPHLRISEIAFAAGFQSLSQFNRVFKRFSGKSPNIAKNASNRVVTPAVENPGSTSAMLRAPPLSGRVIRHRKKCTRFRKRC